MTNGFVLELHYRLHACPFVDGVALSPCVICVTSFCSKAGVSEVFEGHVGPVTGIHTNSVPGSIDFSQYFLSCSFDWTVKLWNAKVS